MRAIEDYEDDYRDDGIKDKLDIPCYVKFDDEEEDSESYILSELNKMVGQGFFEGEGFEVYSVDGDILVAYKNKEDKYMEYDWEGINNYWTDESSYYRNHEFY